MMRYFILISLFSFNVHAATLDRIPETKKINQSIEFLDDLNLENMKLAIQRQLESFKSSEMSVEFKLGIEDYKRSDLRDSLIHFRNLVDKTITCLEVIDSKTCYSELSLSLNTEFNIYSPIPKASEDGYASGQSLFTAYYSPDLHGSVVKTDKYKHAIYKKPKDKKLLNSTREEIDFKNKFGGHGLELFYVSESRYDIWLLHVEGGGRVQVKNKDGSITKHYLSYDSSNKQKFQMLFKYMLEKGMLVKGSAGIDSQRRYIEMHPEHEQEIMASCPSYIYFKVTQDEPLGVKNIPLTENRSLASDYRLYKEYGILNFIQAKKPVRKNGKVELVPFSRFFINQDTGGAIRGNARSDLYFGFGEKAQTAANHLKQLGNQYFLIKKN
jgi:membrane-bound lytic murein transglycosylase A